MRQVVGLAASLVVWGALVAKPHSGLAAMEVDLALVLAVDISGSMDPDEQQLQRQGFVEAFRSPLVHQAIRGGMLGRIAVVYAEWAGSTVQHVVVPWTVIEAAEEAAALADRLAAAPIQRGPRTSLSGAVDYSVKLLEESDTAPLRKVIDVSGDGVNNQGRAVTLARDEALAQGIIINGLPLLQKRPPGSWDSENLDEYFRDCVIGGPGAFMIPVRERHQFDFARLVTWRGRVPPCKARQVLIECDGMQSETEHRSKDFEADVMVKAACCNRSPAPPTAP